MDSPQECKWAPIQNKDTCPLKSGDSYHKVLVCDNGFTQNRCIEQAKIRHVKG